MLGWTVSNRRNKINVCVFCELQMEDSQNLYRQPSPFESETQVSDGQMCIQIYFFISNLKTHTHIRTHRLDTVDLLDVFVPPGLQDG